MAIDKEKIKEHMREILVAIGENPDREGLRDTPQRVANMFEEVFEGVCYSNSQIAEMFNVTFEDDVFNIENQRDIIIVKNIEFFSYCEHHLALMYNMRATVAYIPNNKILGLSKIARVVNMVGKRLQLQERIGKDIAEIMQIITESQDVAVFIDAQHSCMTARGIKNGSSVTSTITLRGRFHSDSDISDKFMSLLNR